MAPVEDHTHLYLPAYRKNAGEEDIWACCICVQGIVSCLLQLHKDELVHKSLNGLGKANRPEASSFPSFESTCPSRLNLTAGMKHFNRQHIGMKKATKGRDKLSPSITTPAAELWKIPQVR